MTLKQKMIKIINKELDKNIPLDYPIKTHQGRKFKDCGGFNWYLKGGNFEYDNIGGCEPLSIMANHKGRFSFLRDGFGLEIIREIN